MKYPYILHTLFWLGASSQVCTAYRQPVNPYNEADTAGFLQPVNTYSDADVTSFPPHGNTTSVAPTDNSYPTYVGFIAAVVAVIVYGSVFVPVKKYETGDGVFYQWMMCAGVWLVGIVLQLIRRSTFYPLVMLGGAIWTTGNMCVVPIIKTIGMGLGLCIWNTFNLLGGWASGRFGWFGITPEVPKHQALNYVGVALAVSSSLIYTFVKNTVTTPSIEIVVRVDETNTETQPLITKEGERSINEGASQGQEAANDHSFVDRLSPLYKKIIGVSLSCASGLMYGLSFAPSIHVQDNKKDEGASQNSLDYVFAQYCGIFLTSSVYFVLYGAVKRNKPRVYPAAILPGILSGVLWAIATACWFVANKALSEPVAFPIITTIPGAIASLFWGVCIYKEIKGTRNILILLLAVGVTTAGAVLAGISRG